MIRWLRSLIRILRSLPKDQIPWTDERRAMLIGYEAQSTHPRDI